MAPTMLIGFPMRSNEFLALDVILVPLSHMAKEVMYHIVHVASLVGTEVLSVECALFFTHTFFEEIF